MQANFLVFFNVVVQQYNPRFGHLLNDYKKIKAFYKKVSKTPQLRFTLAYTVVAILDTPTLRGLRRPSDELGWDNTPFSNANLF